MMDPGFADAKGHRHESKITDRRDSVRESPSLGLPSRPRSNLDNLRVLLRGEKLPQPVFRRIQDALTAQSNSISRLQRDLHDQRGHVERAEDAFIRSKGDARRALDDLNRKARDLDEVAKELNKERIKLEDVRVAKAQRQKDLEELNQIMDLGTKVLAERNDENERLQEEMQSLRSSLADRDSTITSLRESVLHMTMAAPDGFAAFALEAQARQVLAMVNGLQQDVAEKDALIADRQQAEDELSQAIGQYKDEATEAQKTIEDLRASLEASKVRASEAQGVLDSQSDLIKRLMQENARLSA